MCVSLTHTGFTLFPFNQCVCVVTPLWGYPFLYLKKSVVLAIYE